jgi:hypothetical protein
MFPNKIAAMEGKPSDRSSSCSVPEDGDSGGEFASSVMSLMSELLSLSKVVCSSPEAIMSKSFKQVSWRTESADCPYANLELFKLLKKGKHFNNFD